MYKGLISKSERNRINKLFGKNQTLSLDIRSWDNDYQVDMLSDNGFEITETAYKKVKGRYVKREGGSHSSVFGTGFEDDDGFAEIYSCKCGHLTGTLHEGEICGECETVCKYVGVNMSMTGWISLKHHYIIHPIYFLKLKDMFDKDTLFEIINYDMDVDLNGNIIQKPHSTNPFYGIGISEFRERFSEIIAYYMTNKKRAKNKIRAFNEVMIAYHKGLLFQQHIPVYSSLLRDNKLTDSEYQFDKVDKKINMIFSQVSLLNGWRTPRKSRIPTENALSKLQNYINQYWLIVCADISGKYGIIKDGIMGGRINFSARDVIIPDPTLNVNEVKIGYVLGMELYRLDIICMLVKLKNITYNEAYEEWAFGMTHFDERLYKILCHVVANSPFVVPNRNPSIDFGSLMTFNIVGVDDGYDESYVLKISIASLAKFNADFDGDRMNLMRLIVQSHIDAFRENLDPKFAMQISKIDGRFDRDFGLVKDQILGLHLFNTI